MPSKNKAKSSILKSVLDTFPANPVGVLAGGVPASYYSIIIREPGTCENEGFVCISLCSAGSQNVFRQIYRSFACISCVFRGSRFVFRCVGLWGIAIWTALCVTFATRSFEFLPKVEQSSAKTEVSCAFRCVSLDRTTCSAKLIAVSSAFCACSADRDLCK